MGDVTMSMEHKAFLFDHAAFTIELRPVLEAALVEDDAYAVRTFIEDHRDKLVDPYEGEPLDDDWESLIEEPDVQEYGDFALTKYYAPLRDIGLGYDWESAQEIILQASGLPYSPILGTPVGDAGSEFDPGRMGAYFQSAEEVRCSLDDLVAIAREYSGIEQAIEMLDTAVSSSTGLYATF